MVERQFNPVAAPVSDVTPSPVIRFAGIVAAGLDNQGMSDFEHVAFLISVASRDSSLAIAQRRNEPVGRR